VGLAAGVEFDGKVLEAHSALSRLVPRLGVCVLDAV
jgi:hypothetical protein